MLTDAERDAATPEERARDDRVRVAIRRFVDGAIVRPHGANRPLWASDPHFALVKHLKDFVFAFHDTIYKRAVKEAVEHTSLAPAMMLALTFVPMMLFADWLRDLIKDGPEGPAWKRNWSTKDHLQYAIKRAGLLGRDELTSDVSHKLMKGQPSAALTEALGPTASQIRYVAKHGLSLRDAPTQVLWRDWVN